MPQARHRIPAPISASAELSVAHQGQRKPDVSRGNLRRRLRPFFHIPVGDAPAQDPDRPRCLVRIRRAEMTLCLGRFHVAPHDGFQLIAAGNVRAAVGLFQKFDFACQVGKAAAMRHVQDDVFDLEHKAQSRRIAALGERCPRPAQDVIVGIAQKRDEDFLLAREVVVEARD